MNIQEAVKKAMETDGQIFRENYMKGFNKKLTIKPSNGYANCCFCRNGIPDPRGKDWSPSAEDLAADDWNVIKG